MVGAPGTEEGKLALRASLMAWGVARRPSKTRTRSLTARRAALPQARELGRQILEVQHRGLARGSVAAHLDVVEDEQAVPLGGQGGDGGEHLRQPRAGLVFSGKGGLSRGASELLLLLLDLVTRGRRWFRRGGNHSLPVGLSALTRNGGPDGGSQDDAGFAVVWQSVKAEDEDRTQTR